MSCGYKFRELRRTAIYLALGTAITGCASVSPQAPESAQEEAETFQPPKGKSRIYVIFPASGEESTCNSFLLNGKWGTCLEEGTYWMKDVEPGEHTLAGEGGLLLDGTELTVDTGSGEALFFQLGTVDGILLDITKFNIVPAKTGKAMVRRHYRVQPGEE